MFTLPRGGIGRGGFGRIFEMGLLDLGLVWFVRDFVWVCRSNHNFFITGWEY